MNNEIILKGGWEGCNPPNPFPLRRHYKGINPPFIHFPTFSLEFWKSNFLELQLTSACRPHFLPVRWSNWVFVFSVTMPSPLHVLAPVFVSICLYFRGSLASVQPPTFRAWTVFCFFLQTGFRTLAIHPRTSRICQSSPEMGMLLIHVGTYV